MINTQPSNNKSCHECSFYNTSHCKSCDHAYHLSIELEEQIPVCNFCGCKITEENDSRWSVPIADSKWAKTCIDCHYGINTVCTECGWKGNDKGLPYGKRTPDMPDDALPGWHVCPKCGGRADRIAGIPGSGKEGFEKEERMLKEKEELNLVN